MGNLSGRFWADAFENPRCDLSRRETIRLAAGITLCCGLPSTLDAASDFWNRKPVSAWSGPEIIELTSHSPWAHEVNAEFDSDADYTTNGVNGPSVGRGGVIGAPNSPGAGGQFEIGGNRNDAQQRGAKHREPVVVRWESAQPIIDASGNAVSRDFEGRYVLSVSGLPLGVMERHRGQMPVSVDPEQNTPAALQRRMIEQLQNSATLQARDLEPEQPGMVRAVPRTPGTYLFGFSRDLLPITVAAKEVLFNLATGLITVRARFVPKEMLYHGKLSV